MCLVARAARFSGNPPTYVLPSFLFPLLLVSYLRIHSSSLVSLLFLNHDASRWRWGSDLGAVAAAREGESQRRRAAASDWVQRRHRVRCLRTSHIWHTCYISSTCCHCTHSLSHIEQSHTPLACAKLLVRRRCHMDSFRGRRNCRIVCSLLKCRTSVRIRKFLVLREWTIVI